MKIKLLIKLAILLVVVALYIHKYYKNKKSGDKGDVYFYNLDEGNQSKLLIKNELPRKWLDEVRQKYDWNNFDEYDNRLWEYMDKLFDIPVAQSGIEYEAELWKKLNRPQKTFWTFLVFNGEVDNGGIYQFIFNRPEFLFAVKEMLHEIGMEKLAEDYQKVIDEAIEKAEALNKIKEEAASKTDEESWKAFTKGYKLLKTPEEIEDYYYDKEFKRELYKKMAGYIEKNIDKFAVFK